ncbi:Cyclic-nucleotide-regulated bacteriocin/lantibiotic efflux ABC transporter, permease/ATP-binding protein [uncultured Synechococcales cyanobacterium]|uniref:Cyclic-nucleotide-regulated bacteriocin/lantibiotic efflux ABC transporter, permease/ATP-binding protein n=1 Tax=uncultured Synechococcales cyanobacterium TaxID=1936017 RepID=A0A6J4VXL6_9CYAN|nr:Cyclic-nucleotide-regulated bacteriocin/lantibiotic efflux ABC transporter, permease/ATP-binding protein [uncultured Synechococcales cyanobacterium]
MNQGLGIQNRSQLTEELSYSLPIVLKLLTQIQADASLASAFDQAFVVDDFQLGDELITYTAPEISSHQQNGYDFHLVCQGRVRLLCFDQAREREVSALVLEEETFGADHLFRSSSLPYRAIAASSGQVARMSTANLQLWLERLPNLRTYLTQQAQQRECLLFFKSTTTLRKLPSQQLQQFVSYLLEQDVPAGELLYRFAPADSGHFWLRSGQVQSQGNSQPPMLGESWGYPQTTPTDWMAQTNLMVYKLSVEHWQAAQGIVPALSANALARPEPGKFVAPIDASATGRDKMERSAQSLTTNGSSSRRPQFQLRRPLLPKAQTQDRQAEVESVTFAKPSRPKRLGHLFPQRYPYVEQQSEADCGAACLAMIGRYWGKRFSLNFLRNLARVGRSGASLKSLAKAAENLGFHARPVRASFSRLQDQTNPWIAHWQSNHYVVVYQVRDNRVLIADPAMGRRSLSLEQFQEGWTGYALLLEPTDQLESAETQKGSLGRFWRILWPQRSVLLQIVLASVLLQIFGLITPLFTQIILDRVVVQKSLITLHVFAVGLILFGVWRVGLTAIRQYLLDYVSNRLDLTLISGFISHTLTLPLKFFESRHVGDVITRVQENQKIQLFLTRQAVVVWLDALMIFVYLGLMVYYNWKLTLLVLAIIPPIVILTLVATPLMRRLSREVFNNEAAENSSLVEMLNGVATVKTAAVERDLRWRWEDLLTSTLNTQFRTQKLSNGLRATSGLINSLGSTAILWYGAMLVIQEQLTIGQFVAFNMLIGNVISPILALVALWYEFQEVIISVERLDDVFTAQPEESPQKPLLSLPRLEGHVRFEDVTFRYEQEEDRNTLQNISFEVPAGQTIAIVGRSGSGKSTLVSLIQGLYHPSSGRIWMDEYDIRHVSPQSLRSQLGVVPQECFLFSGTILENITLYRPEFSLEQVTKVAKLAEAHAFIQELPLGYNTKVGERGSTLSGGQRQRIAIARALLGNPRILVLDEATSSLDTESERRFQQNLARISRDRTTFIIAHRLSTVRHADCILVLQQGLLAERGTHDELIALQGIYYHLAQQQLEL